MGREGTGGDRAGSAVYGTRGKGRQKDKGTGKRDGNLQLPSLFDATYFVTVLYGDFCLLY